MLKLMIESLTSASEANMSGRHQKRGDISPQIFIFRDTFVSFVLHSVCVLSFAEKQRELARKGSLKNNNTVGSPVNQQPKKNNVMARTRWGNWSTVSTATGFAVAGCLALGSSTFDTGQIGIKPQDLILKCGNTLGSAQKLIQGFMQPGESWSCWVLIFFNEVTL